ncbi:molybdate ABC transporter substrate-binding protein [Planococcus salinus]|uniref:Molybdate ABC transporter substrate-binding protein n=1 Tax=Planococcus salinus TaxID=1848460 RepID=A0A3M8PDC0_9BACL|nr:molybdate ABC transporter substrate-binding protein [Planococcus salinus]RNF41181.1 molybdate ABC transporter substrate-binding protein [Planococcus salinus]
MRRTLLFLTITLLLAGCGTTSADRKDELFISAASSLTDAMQAAETEFGKAHPDIELVINYGSSGKLSNQIEQGAPVDLFLSASAKDMDRLVEGELIDGTTVVPFASNHLVLASTAAVDEVPDFSAVLQGFEGKIAIGEPESVPLGMYTREALTELDLWESIEERVIYAKDARQVVSYLESGNVEAGIIYSSDQGLAQGLQTMVELPDTGEAIIYPAGISSTAENQEAAEAFLAFLTGEEGQEVLEQFGFRAAEGVPEK